MRLLLPVVLLLGAVGVGAEQRCDTSEFPLSAPTERFEDNGDGTVTDTASGLMWMRCALGQHWSGSACDGEPTRYDWDAARVAADAVNGEGAFFFSDWRVPGLRDLAMIVERQCVAPRTNLSVFPNTPPAFFWSSTLRGADEGGPVAYALSFGPDGVEHRPANERHFVRLVRTAR
jgi:hypothetical protein